ncbi:MAG: hypothetical protein JWN36_515 [Microbacteriaceae bacterium]|nr:hypothetical protein [Microbacteriaceae bacterium]
MYAETTRPAKLLVVDYFRLWNTGDLALAEGLIAPGFVNHADPSVTDTETLRDAVVRMRTDDPALHVFVDALLGGRGMVTAVGRVVRGRAGEPAVVNTVWTFRMDGPIAEIWRHRDAPVAAERTA